MARQVDAVVYAELKRQNGQLHVSGVVVKKGEKDEEQSQEGDANHRSCTGGCTVNACDCKPS